MLTVRLGVAISIHTPREGGDDDSLAAGQSGGLFQSTPPRGRRRHRWSRWCWGRHFNPRPPRGGRRGGWTQNYGYIVISIHAPAKGATSEPMRAVPVIVFQSTPPARGGDVTPTCWITGTSDFNPRPPPRGGDRWCRWCRRLSWYFNPRPPRGGRPRASRFCLMISNFNPRPPRGGRRRHEQRLGDTLHFNPRPREGGDCCSPHRLRH